MEWIAQNWIWLLLGGAMLGMHLFGHGKHGHGGGGGCCGGGKARTEDTPDRSKSVSTVEEH